MRTKTGFRCTAFFLSLLMVLPLVVSCTGNTENPDTLTSTESTSMLPEEKSSAEESSEESTAKVLSDREFFYADNFASDLFSFSGEESVAVMSFLSCLMYYESCLQSVIARGGKWVYSSSNTYSKQNSTFAEMYDSGMYGNNCSHPSNWAFKDLGTYPGNIRYYANTDGSINNWAGVQKYIEAVCDVEHFTKLFTFEEMYRAGDVQPGDVYICGNPAHVFVYLGDQKFFAAGHDAHWHSDPTAPTNDERKAVFDSFIYDMEQCSNYRGFKISHRFRLKDEYIPQFYYNHDGKLVQNRMYDPTSTLVYSAEQGFGYESSGRDNVLAGLTTSASAGVNLKKLNTNKNITDNQIFYDVTTATYADVQMNGGASYAKNPTFWFDANGEKSTVLDAAHKYLCGIKYTLPQTCVVTGFSYYSQNVLQDGGLIGDIDGFDILVSEDGKNWTVVFSIENASSDGKWKDVTDERNTSAKGNAMSHFLDETFDKAYHAKYIMFGLTCGRTQKKSSQGVDYFIQSTATDYFRIVEFQVYGQNLDDMD